MTNRPTDAQAISYVIDHFEKFDYGFRPSSFAASPNPSEPGATNVAFDDGRTHVDGPAIMTVWFEDVGNGQFLYGEW